MLLLIIQANLAIGKSKILYLFLPLCGIPFMKPRSKPGQRVQLHRAFSKLGMGSRGMAWKLIVDGKVRVNNRVIRDPLTWIDTTIDRITCENTLLEKPTIRVWMVNKPKGLVCTRSDERGKPTVYSLFPESDFWKFPVGRLDADSEGLLLFTNDGPLADALTDPTRGVEKRYLVTVAGHPQESDLAQLSQGIDLLGQRTRPSKWSLVSKEREFALLEVVLHEGKNRQIRRMVESIGHRVLRLVRVAMGHLQLGDLAVGAIRELPREEWPVP